MLRGSTLLKLGWTLAALASLTAGCTKKDAASLTGATTSAAGESTRYQPVATTDTTTGESYGAALPCTTAVYYSWDNSNPHTCLNADDVAVTGYVNSLSCDTTTQKFYLTGDQCSETRTEVASTDIETFDYNTSIVGIKSQGLIFQQLPAPPPAGLINVELWANATKGDMHYDVIVMSPGPDGKRNGNMYYSGPEARGFVALPNLTRSDSMTGRVYQGQAFTLTVDPTQIVDKPFKYRSVMNAVFFGSYYGFSLFTRED